MSLLNSRLLSNIVLICVTGIALVSATTQIILSNSTTGFSATVKESKFPDPKIDLPISAVKKEQTLVLAGGCFWGMEAVFEHLKGVSKVVSGYAGGKNADTAHYEIVSGGNTGHAESVKITYDPYKISYGQILKIYFAVAHDPTQLNRQGPDSGSQYRSVIFYTNNEEKKVAQSYISQLNKLKIFGNPIVTQVVPLNKFYAAEDYHQHFIARNPNYPYVVINDLPKLQQLKSQFPNLYKN